jgi:hypothetical protein
MQQDACFQRPLRLVPDPFAADLSQHLFQTLTSTPATAPVKPAYQFASVPELAPWLAPLSLDELSTRYWDQDLAHLPATPQRQSLYSLQQFGQHLLSTPPEAIRLSHQGKPVALQNYLRGNLQQSLHNLFQAPEISLRILGLERHPQALEVKRVHELLQGWSRCRVQAIAFYSAPGESVIPIHWDTENLLIFQIAGTKHWEITPASLTRPLHFQRSDAYLGLAAEPAGETRQIALNPGELLFVPRGWLHRARAQQEPTLHITFGIYMPTWFDLLMHTLDLAQFEAAHDPGLRALVNTPEAGSDPEHLRKLLIRVLQAADLRAVDHYFQQPR